MKRIISSLVSAGISTAIISAIFFLIDYSDKSKGKESIVMFSWTFVMIYFLLMFVASLLKDDFNKFFKRIFQKIPVL